MTPRGLGTTIRCVSIEDTEREGIWTKGLGKYVTSICTLLVAWVWEKTETQIEGCWADSKEMSLSGSNIIWLRFEPDIDLNNVCSNFLSNIISSILLIPFCC